MSYSSGRGEKAVIVIMSGRYAAGCVSVNTTWRSFSPTLKPSTSFSFMYLAIAAGCGLTFENPSQNSLKPTKRSM